MVFNISYLILIIFKLIFFNFQTNELPIMHNIDKLKLIFKLQLTGTVALD